MNKYNVIEKYIGTIPVWRSNSTRYRYPRVVREFLDSVGVKDKYTKQDIISFFNNEIKRGISPSSIRWKYYILRGFLESIGDTMLIKVDELPRISNINQPVLTKDDVVGMINIIKDKGTNSMKAYLALSTVYGFRRSELANIRNDSFSDGVIQIATAKGGAVRSHIIPENIVPYVSNYNFVNRSQSWFGDLFKHMGKLSGIKDVNGYGFHAIRRSLITEMLTSGVPVPIIVYFMGWNIRRALGGFGIAGAYFHPNKEEVDEVVFRNHPFLKYW